MNANVSITAKSNNLACKSEMRLRIAKAFASNKCTLGHNAIRYASPHKNERETAIASGKLQVTRKLQMRLQDAIDQEVENASTSCK